MIKFTEYGPDQIRDIFIRAFQRAFEHLAPSLTDITSMDWPQVKQTAEVLNLDPRLLNIRSVADISYFHKSPTGVYVNIQIVLDPTGYIRAEAKVSWPELRSDADTATANRLATQYAEITQKALFATVAMNEVFLQLFARFQPEELEAVQHRFAASRRNLDARLTYMLNQIFVAQGATQN